MKVVRRFAMGFGYGQKGFILVELLSVLAQETLEVQRAVVGILATLKSIAKTESKTHS